MDIKDAYLHGTVGVVKSINLKENTSDTLTYTLADVSNTTVEITLPEATTDANGLLSKDDKTKIDSLKSAAYTESSDYAVSKSLTIENLNDVIIPGFYNAGGSNSVTNSPLTLGTHFGLLVIHGASGSYYVLLLYEAGYSDKVWRRHCQNGDWSNWVLDSLTDTTYSVFTGATTSLDGTSGLVPAPTTNDSLKFLKGDGTWGTYSIVDKNGPGLAPLVSTSTTAVTNAYYVLASSNGQNAPSWYKLPSNAFVNDDSKVTQTNTTATTSTLYRVLFSKSATNNEETDIVRKSEYLTYDPSVGVLSANTVNASTLIGNLDGSYINALTGYSNPTASTTVLNLAATDTLLNALQKLEKKADVANAWIDSVTGTEDSTDTYINKWQEIIDFLDGVKDDTNILDEFVTRKTDLTITGLKSFSRTLKMIPTTSGTNATGFVYFDSNGNNATSGIGSFFRDGVYEFSYIGWGTAPWTGSTSLRISPTALTYQNQSVLHSGNYLNYVKILANYFSERPETCDYLYGDGSLRHFKATHKMTTSKPPMDAHVLHFAWDNNGGWESQLAISTALTPNVYVRGQGKNPDDQNKPNIWGNWITLLSSGNYTTYTVKKDGTGASGTWGINITGAATSLSSWAEASSTSTKRYVWMSYNDNSGKACYDSGLTYLADTSTLWVSGNLEVGDTDANHTFALKGSSSLLKLFAWGDATYIESGNSNFSANKPLKITGIGGNTGSDLYLDFDNIYCRGTESINIDSGNYKSILDNTYLQLSGGTLTGSLGLGQYGILGFGSSIDSKYTDSATIAPLANAVWLATTGGGGESAGIMLDGDKIKLWSPMDSSLVYIDSDNGNSYTILHSGNYTTCVNTTNFPGLHKTGTVTSVTLTQGTGITVSSSGTAITTSGSRTISLNAASTTAIGGIQLGYTATGANIPLLTSSNKGFVALTKSAVLSALGVTINTGTANRIAYYSGSTTIACNSNITIGTNSISCSGGFYETSDERLKDFYDDIKIDFEKLSKLPKKYFKWKQDQSKLNIGTSAQELQKLYPELVNTDDGILHVAYDKLSIIALKGIDTLYDEIKKLKARIEYLELK